MHLEKGQKRIIQFSFLLLRGKRKNVKICKRKNRFLWANIKSLQEGNRD